MNNGQALTWREQLARAAHEALERYRESAQKPRPSEPIRSPLQDDFMFRRQAE